jgi:PAS domain S-box-containing protein
LTLPYGSININQFGSILYSEDALALLDVPKSSRPVSRRRRLWRTKADACSKTTALDEIRPTLLGLLFDSLNCGIRIIDCHGYVQSINDYFASISGVSQEAAIGKQCWQVFRCPDCKTTKCRLERLKHGENLIKIETERVRSDGKTIPCMIVALPMQKTDGALAGVIEAFWDLSEKRQLESRSRESEELYRALIDLSSEVGEAITLLQDQDGLEGKYIFVSDSWLKITGYSREELYGMSAFDIISPNCMEEARQVYRSVMSGIPLPGLIETNIVRKDGTEVTLELATALTSYQGRPAKVNFFRDVTQRRLDAAGLRESEQRLNAIINAADESIWLFGADDTILSANETASSRLKMGVSEVVGRNWKELVPAEIASVRRAKMEEVFKTGLPLHFEDERGGMVFNHSFYPVRDGQGNVTSVVSFSRDITNSKQMEQALREQESRQRNIMDNMMEGCQLIGFDYRYLYVNHAAEVLHQVPREEKLGRSIEDVYPEASNNYVYQAIRECMLKRRPLSFEAEYSSPEGKVSWLEYHIFPVQEGVLVESMDITSRKSDQLAFEEHHQAVEKMVASRTSDLEKANNQLKDEVAYRSQVEESLSDLYKIEKELRLKLENQATQRVNFTRALVHELKTPLTPILAASEMLHRGLHEKQLRPFVTAIVDSAHQMDNRVDELLDLARGEIGQLRLETREIHPRRMLLSLAESLYPEATRLNHNFKTEIPRYLPTIIADEKRLKQVVQNLLVNAMKFTPPGGMIVLRAWRADGNLMVEVQDNGAGIEKADQERLFQAYYRVEADRARFSGLGLGLALSKTIIELHQGTIWVRSTPGQGSTFGFEIPIKGNSKAYRPKKQRKVEAENTQP